MFGIMGTTITITRGDTARIDVAIKNYTPTEGDRIKFAVKKDYEDETELITKYIDPEEMLLEIMPSDTKPLAFGRYVYDMELTTTNGDVDTFIRKAIFNVSEEVG